MAKKTLRDVLIEKGMQAWVDAWDYVKNDGKGPEDFLQSTRGRFYFTAQREDYTTGKMMDVEVRVTAKHLLTMLTEQVPSDVKTLQDVLLRQEKEAYLDCWDYDANGGKSPVQFAPSSTETIYLCKDYYDDSTGKNHHFEWATTPLIMNKSAQKREPCPFLWKHNGLIKAGFNDFATLNPEIMSEWDYEANEKNELDPTRMSAKCNDTCFWKQRVYDLRDGQIKELKWAASADERAIGFGGCPELSQNGISRNEKTVAFYVKKYFPDAIENDRTVLSGKELDVYIPSRGVAIEYDGMFYHKEIRNDVLKNALCAEKRIHLFRIREDGAPAMKENENLSILNFPYTDREKFETTIKSLLQDLGVPESEIDINLKRDYDSINMQATKSNYILLPNDKTPEPMMLARKIQAQTQGTSFEKSRDESLKMAAKACAMYMGKNSENNDTKDKTWSPREKSIEQWAPKKKSSHHNKETRERER